MPPKKKPGPAASAAAPAALEHRSAAVSEVATATPPAQESSSSAPASVQQADAKTAVPEGFFAPSDQGAGALYMFLDGMSEASEPPSAPRSMSQEDFVTVVVTPKLTFQLLRRPEWETVQDISQAELRRGFLSRFPPALWMSSEKFCFRPALPPTARLTEETKTLFFKIVSDDVPDERIMLGILRELEKSYEAIIRRAVSETRSESTQEQLVLQEQAEEARREAAKQVKELRKENKSLREQLQSIQKRLFLVEQEKDQLQKEQHQTKEHVLRLGREQAAQVQSSRSEQQDVRAQLDALRLLFEGHISSAKSVGATDKSASSRQSRASAAAATDRSAGAATDLPTSVAEDAADKQTGGCRSKANSDSEVKQSSVINDPNDSSLQRADIASQTDPMPLNQFEERRPDVVEDVSRRVDQLQQQLGALQGWMFQGSQLLNLAGGSESATRMPID